MNIHSSKIMPTISGLRRRNWGDLLLFGVTAVEFCILIFLTPTFEAVDWIYLLQHLMVLGIALSRSAPLVQDRSLGANVAVVVAYAYPYAQIAYLRWVPGQSTWPEGAIFLIVIGAGISLMSLFNLGRSFGVRPALRQLATRGPYHFVRHPIYLSYVIADIGYNMEEWNYGTALMVAAGWASLVYRIGAEERMLAHDGQWRDYTTAVRYRLIPGVW